ncbi:hypothetical protein L861_17030 [Litchfieldella anticariensis FP35 = DSM 16096]|uniref:PEP-CTERM/exosortase system-associated acyltransferase n=1 Tax=Litchfieldella anticariensis (strain DSM 16096 / CECT 5854 / CIP 108499 / LMG 22089 / FP35) TaxID=1121939 RepID=S2LA40_LITA3|nr:PEP-CTERM/exosortase system-associated acyltransferase [Halomonas anticariensis]EPC01576.1 hypothetical protein L861_17030 [Halomonas anticariensis FP35 = DSM 16096]
MNIFNLFSDHFRFRIALSEKERSLAFKVRYDVFLRELHYTTLKEDPVTQQEKDVYDEKALLCLLEHRHSKTIAGCIRVVIPHEGAPPPLEQLPIEYYCGHSLNHHVLHPAKFPKQQICEVSRLAVPGRFRRRAGNGDTASEALDDIAFTPEERRTFPLIGVSFFLAATALIGFMERPHVFAMMEPRFARLLTLSGLRFQQIGEMMNYHGPRAAYYIDQRQAVSDLSPHLRELYHHIESELVSQYRQTSI